MAEAFGYREALADIREFFDGKRWLSVSDVGRYTGLRDVRTIHRHFPYFVNGHILDTTLAKLMCGGGGRR